MYKFNFLNKINQEKLEIKKRNRFIKMVFIATTISLSLILIVMYLRSFNIKSESDEAKDIEQKIELKTTEFRKNDFFKYRLIENMYNSITQRKKISAIMTTFASVLDSNVVINGIILGNEATEIRFISRSSESKSQIMTIANNIKNDISEKLLKLKIIDEKKPIKLLRGPDLRKTFDNFQYWSFDLEILFKTEPVKATNNSGKQKNGIAF